MASRNPERLDTIKAGPHWRVVIRPQPYLEERIPHEELFRTVARSTVRYRGWDFPHLNPHEQPEVRTSFVASSDDFYGHVEYWRLYTSGQFVYLGGVREATEPGWREKLQRTAQFRLLVPGGEFDWSQVPGFIEILNFVYVMTEIWEFAARLGQAAPATESVQVSIGLHHITGFVLTVGDFQRGELHGYYASHEAVLEHSWEVPLRGLVSSTVNLTVEASRWFLVRFGWTEPNIEVIRTDIEELRKHRG